MGNRDPSNARNKGIKAAVIRLSSWIQLHILARSIPNGLELETKAPRIMMKMDVEGSEYRLLTDLIVTGTLCHIDVVTVESHHHKPNLMPAKIHHNISLSSVDAANYYKSMLLMTRAYGTEVYDLG